MRDINGRDAVPERRAKRRYLDMSVRRKETSLALQTGAGNIPFIATGKLRGASVITIFLHGQGGDEKLGSRDLIFGGNFNRIRNLMARNGGLYVTPTFRDFGETGADQVASLIDELLKQSPRAEVIVACGSMGGYICHRLAHGKATVKQLTGLIYLAAPADKNFTSSAAYRARLPVFIGHGSRDPVFAIGDADRFYGMLRAGSDGYPVRMDRYESGNHGTPIRMIDWRRTINWILAQ
ncbi:alpha/beta hydrolase [Notoacmeibacter sp. MSK16QG-6]|uniref:alpha/beta hydrolase n=1 Tax=Notoacmeibacter sp. MSK16QG-6 TaxID=2957982 RepID=UPI00209C8C6D|nr:alpha/beta fold hydrolase [Notoacmeibacter sp. MSK16QG-6]MCP1199434.1 alpha/beta hydrolase [Notoacmeibacter sp. MSK16QG-6]